MAGSSRSTGGLARQIANDAPSGFVRAFKAKEPADKEAERSRKTMGKGGTIAHPKKRGLPKGGGRAFRHYHARGNRGLFPTQRLRRRQFARAEDSPCIESLRRG